jgi:hypothetical protein
MFQPFSVCSCAAAFYGSVILTTMNEAHFIEPMPCLAVQKLPEGEAWQYELKLDGYRALAVNCTHARRCGASRAFSEERPCFEVSSYAW